MTTNDAFPLRHTTNGVSFNQLSARNLRKRHSYWRFGELRRYWSIASTLNIMKIERELSRTILFAWRRMISLPIFWPIFFISGKLHRICSRWAELRTFRRLNNMEAAVNWMSLHSRRGWLVLVCLTTNVELRPLICVEPCTVLFFVESRTSSWAVSTVKVRFVRLLLFMFLIDPQGLTFASYFWK